MASEKDATCENDPNFAVICAFFQKFSHMLNIQHPDFGLLQEWLENTDEVAEGLKLLHIRLLRKLRKTVHETAWETALSKFCFGYSAQDAWEIERFGYKKSSLKVKLRILKELAESQFQRNGKFRNTFLTLSADELRSQPVGRDKLGHSYWLTQDPNLNLRIYQEHLDEEIWRVVASNRDELITLINRLKGNEVVLPSVVGIVDEDTSSSNSCPLLVKPPPPEEKDDSQEEIVSTVTTGTVITAGTTTVITTTTTTTTNNEAKVPNIKIKLDTFTIERKTNDISSCIKKENGAKNKMNSSQIESDGMSEEGDEEMDEEGEEEEDEEDGDADDEDIEEEQEDYDDGDDVDDHVELKTECDEKRSQKVNINKNLNRNSSKVTVKGIKEEKPEKINEKLRRKSQSKEDKQRQINYENGGRNRNGATIQDENKRITNDKTTIIEKAKDVELKEISDKRKPEEVKIEKKVKPIVISQSKSIKIEDGQSKKRSISEIMYDRKDDLSNMNVKKSRPTLLNTGREKNISKYEKYNEEDDDDDDDDEEEEEQDEEMEEEEEGETEEGEEEEEENGEDESDEEVPVENEIKEKVMIIKGEGNGAECKCDNFLNSIKLGLDKDNEEATEPEVGEAIEEDVMIFKGEGNGEDCLVGNSKEETTDKSNFYFGQPGCLKLSPLKKIDTNKTKNTDSNKKIEEKIDEINKNKEIDEIKNGESIEENEEKQDLNEKISENMNTENCSQSEKINEEEKEEAEKEQKESAMEKIIEQNNAEEIHKDDEMAQCSTLVEDMSDCVKNQKVPTDENENSDHKELDKQNLEKNELEMTEQIKNTEDTNKSISSPENQQPIISEIEPQLTTISLNESAKNLTVCRKRRLSAERSEKPQPKQTSDSETDLNSENIEENMNYMDDEEMIGGKRAKMRSKLVNSEIRKKIEAKRNDVEKETSSSSEAELSRKRQSPKKFDVKTPSPPEIRNEDTEKVGLNLKLEEKEETISENSGLQIKNEVEAESKQTEIVDNQPLEEPKVDEPIENSIATNDSNTNLIPKECEITTSLLEENLQPPAKTTRSTRRSMTEPLFKDLPSPKRKARGLSAVPRKHNTPKTTKTKAQNKKRMMNTEIKAKPSKNIEEKTTPTEELKTEIVNEEKVSDVLKVEEQSLNEVKKEEEEEEENEVEKNDGNKKDLENSIESEEKIEHPKEDSEHIEKADEVNQLEDKKEIKPSEEASEQPAPKKKQRRKREIDISNIIPEADIAPVRQSRRIAQLKIKEEAERRKLEEIALKKMKEDLKKKKKEESKLTGKPVEASEVSNSSKEEYQVEEEEDNSEVDLKKKVEKKRKKRTGWSSCTESEAEEEEEELIFDHHESDRVSPLLLKSDHEFSPESELEDTSEVVPLKRARTARKEGEIIAEDVEDDQACQKCGKKDHPEWILLCDKCDKGYHCSCLSPVLFIIPEGNWFCPPCQQEQLIITLENHLKEFDELIEKKKEDEIKRQLAIKAAEEAEEERRAKRAINIEMKRAARNHRKYSDDSEIGYEDEDEDDYDDADDEFRNGKRELKLKKESDKRSRKKRKVRGRSYESRSFSSHSSKSFSSSSDSNNGSYGSSQSADSDDEPIYKLRKRRQVNVSYRFNEYDDLINSAIKDEMDEVAGAGNLGRGKDISTIIEADKEEKLRQKQLEERAAAKRELISEEKLETVENVIPERKDEFEVVNERNEEISPEIKVKEDVNKEDSGSDFEPLKSKMSLKSLKKKKSRKLNCLDVSSEEDGSDEDFKTSSYETEEEESLSVPTESESSLEVFKRKKNKRPKKKTRRAARRAARNRKKLFDYDSDFVVDDSDLSEDIPKTKKKRKEDSDYTESLTEDDDPSDDVDSNELCDDSTDSESDGAWKPSKKKKQKTVIKRNPMKRKVMHSGKHRKIKRKDEAEKSFRPKLSKNKIRDDEDSQEDGGRKTRGKRFTYLEDYEEESSEDGIKPGVKRPDTPPEEREEFIRKQEEIKRMLAEKNTEAAKVVATPVPKVPDEKDATTTSTSTSISISATTVNTAEPTDSLSTVPLSVIKGAKALDMDYLQRRGELPESDDPGTEFDDDLPDDFNPEDMDEEAIEKMMEEEDFAQQQLKLAGEAIQKKKAKETEVIIKLPENEPIKIPKPSGPVLQEPPRKRLPMPTIQPPLIRNAPQSIIQNLQIASRTNISPHRLVPQNVIRPPPHILPPTSGSNIVLSPKDFGPITPSSPTVPIQSQALIQQQINDLDKPKGRRKKITPLRDTLQKQQAAAAAAAAAVTAAAAATAIKSTKDPPVPDKPLTISGGSNLSIAQPPQLYKPAPNPQPSVITRMPHPPPRPRFPEQSSRFYPPPSQLLLRTPQRHPGIPLPPHPLRPSYAAGPPPLRSSNNSGSPSSISIGNGLSRHPPTFSSSEQYSRTRQPSIHPPYRPPLFGTPGYPPALPPQLSSPQQPSSQSQAQSQRQQLSPHSSQQRQQTPAHSLSHQQSSSHSQQTSPLHPPPPASTILSGANSFAITPYAAGPYGNFFPPHSTPQPLAVPHSTPPPPTATAVPSSVIVSATSLVAQQQQQQQQQQQPPSTADTAPSAPVVLSVETIHSPTSRPRASPLETFNTKSNASSLEAESTQSPYSSNEPADDNDDETEPRSSNTTSEFSGLVSYFSSQQDDLNT